MIKATMRALRGLFGEMGDACSDLNLRELNLLESSLPPFEQPVSKEQFFPVNVAVMPPNRIETGIMTISPSKAAWLERALNKAAYAIEIEFVGDNIKRILGEMFGDKISFERPRVFGNEQLGIATLKVRKSEAWDAIDSIFDRFQLGQVERLAVERQFQNSGISYPSQHQDGENLPNL